LRISPIVTTLINSEVTGGLFSHWTTRGSGNGANSSSISLAGLASA
jgi:hypothetical protein